MKNNLIRAYCSILIALPLLPCSWQGSAAAGTAMRLTTDGAVKYSATISGNGAVVVWIEESADRNYLSIKAVNSDGTNPRTIATSHWQTGIPELKGPRWEASLANYAVVLFHPTLRVSYDGTKAAVLLYEKNPNQFSIWGVVDLVNNTISAIGLGLPTGMGDNADFDALGGLGGMRLDLAEPNRFDITADGSAIIYALSLERLPDGTEAASALIATNTSGTSATRLAGYESAAPGWGGAITYGSGPQHFASPAVSGGYVAFAGSTQTRRWSSYEDDMDTLFAMPVSGGAISNLGASNGYGPQASAGYAYILSSSSQGNFLPLPAGAPSVPITISQFSITPFWDGQAGLVETAVGTQSARDELAVGRAAGTVRQLAKNDSGLPTDWLFGELGGVSYETWRLAADNGSKVIFSMVNSGRTSQDLFILDGLNSESPTPTPTASATPVIVEPTPTATPTPSWNCNLKVLGKCGKQAVNKNTTCQIKTTITDKQTGQGVVGAGYALQALSGKNWVQWSSGTTAAGGSQTKKAKVSKTSKIRAVADGAVCTSPTRTIRIIKKR